MKTYVILKKRDGHGWKYSCEFTAAGWKAAKAKFKSMMTSDLYFDLKKGVYLDEVGNEVWGFGNKGTWFSEDVYIWELLTSKESKKHLI